MADSPDRRGRRLVRAGGWKRGVRWRSSAPTSRARRWASSASGGSARRSAGAPPASGWTCCTNRRRVAPEVEARTGRDVRVAPRAAGRSDFVRIHVPLGPSTRRLIGAEQLPRMKPTAILINTARGPVVDQAALYTALRDGVIGGAALDVTDPEPMPGDDPLLTLDNCLVVPHIASASRATRGKMAAMAAANLIAGVRGERLPNPVNPEIYEAGPAPARLHPDRERRRSMRTGPVREYGTYFGHHVAASTSAAMSRSSARPATPPRRASVATAMATCRAIARRSAIGGQQRPAGQTLVRDRVRQRVGGREEHPVGDGARLRDDRPEAEPREDEHVVRLGDLAHAGRSSRPARTASPSPRARGRRSSAGCRPGPPRTSDVGFDRGSAIGVDVRPPGSDRRLVERAGASRSRRAGSSGGSPRRRRQRGRRPIAASRGEAGGARRVDGPGDLALVVVEVGPPGVDQPVRVDERDRRRAHPRPTPVLGHRQPQQPGDPDPGSAGPGDDDPLVDQPLGRGGASPASDRRRATTAAVPWMSSLNEQTRSR